ASDVALPRLAELVELNQYTDALALAQQLEQILTGDVRVRKLLPDMSRVFDVTTTPPGIEVQVKPYAAPDTAFRSIGKTPLEGVRFPIGYHRVRLLSPGYQTVDLAVATPLP